MLRHKTNVHMKEKYIDPLPPVVKSTNVTFKHPFSMVVSGPSGSGKSVWTKKLLLSSLIQPSPERIIWCYGQWQPLYDNIRKRIPRIEFVNGIPDHHNDQHYIDVSKRNVLVFDDLMTEAKCDQRIADLFTKGSHHRNISVVYLTQNLFPQGKACRDIILNTQYMVLFNNPIDRQQVATLARRIYPSTSAFFMKRFERATSYPYGHLVIDLNSDTPEKDRLHTEIFDTTKKMDEKMAEEFTQGTHHRCVSVILITQNLYPGGKHARTIALNTWYTILMKNLRDVSQVGILGRQLYPGRGKAFLKAYEDAVGSKEGYLIVDTSPHGDDRYRLRSRVFPGQDPLVYRLS